MPKKPEDKKPIKELINQKDAFLTTSEQIYEFCLRHNKILIIGAVAVLMIMAGVALYINQQNKAETKATWAFEQALAGAKQGDPSQLIETLEGIRANYADYKASRLATFTLIGLYTGERQFEKALPLAEYLLQTAKASEISLKPLLLYNLGGLYESSGQMDLALKSFEALLADSKLDPSLKRDALMALGRINSAVGNSEEAIKNYRTVLALFPGYDSAYLANAKLALLEGKAVAFPGFDRPSIIVSGLEDEKSAAIEIESTESAPASAAE